MLNKHTRKATEVSLFYHIDTPSTSMKLDKSHILAKIIPCIPLSRYFNSALCTVTQGKWTLFIIWKLMSPHNQFLGWFFAWIACIRDIAQKAMAEYWTYKCLVNLVMDMLLPEMDLPGEIQRNSGNKSYSLYKFWKSHGASNIELEQVDRNISIQHWTRTSRQKHQHPSLNQN